MDIKIDNDKVKEYVSAAIMQQMDAATREKLIATALEYIMKPVHTTDRHGYGTIISPIERAFKDGVEYAAQEVMRDILKNDPATTAKLRTLVLALVDKILTAPEIVAGASDIVIKILGRAMDAR